MKKLFKYVSKEFIPPFFMGLIAFIVFVSLELLYQLSEIIVRNNVGFSKLLILIWYHLPYFISMGIPVGVLFGIFWVISKLSSANEIIALQTLGIPMKKLIIPFMTISLLLSFFTFALFNTIVPVSNYKAKEAMALYVYQRPQAQIEENQFVDVGDGRYLFVKQIDRESGILYDVLLYEVKNDYTAVFNAQQAQKGLDGWYMKNGRMFRTNEDGFLDLDITFDQLQLDIQEDVEEFLNFSKSANEMTSKELKEKITTFSKLGLDVSGLIVSYQSKFANSLAPLVICILGIALSLFLNLTSKSWSVITTFVLVIIYQGSGAWLSALGKEHIINPTISVWIPNIIFGIIGTFLFLMLDTRVSYKLLEPLKRVFSIILFIFIGSSFFSAPVNITSEDFYLKDDLLFLEGNVYVEYEGSTIKADSAQGELNQDGTIKAATFFGDITYLYEDISIQASEITVNFEEDSAVFVNSYTIQKYKAEKEIDVRIWSESMEKPMQENIIETNQTKLTTCEDCITYYFSARKVDIFPGYFLIARDVVLSFFGVPVLYLPFYFQSLSEDEEEPMSLTFGYDNNEFSLLTEINYKFENGSKVHLSYNTANDLITQETDQEVTLKYGVPFLYGSLYLSTGLNSPDTNDNNLGVSYQFFEDNEVSEIAKLELKVQPATKEKSLSLNIPKLETNLGDLKNIHSHIYWDSKGFDDILFLNVESQAFQKKYGRSLISLSKLKLNSHSYGDISNLSMDQIWDTKESEIDIEGKYNFYETFARMYGDFDYAYTTVATETTKNRLETKNTFSYKDTLYEIDRNNFDLKFNMEDSIHFNYNNDFIPGEDYSSGKSLFDYSLEPGLEIDLGVFEFGNSLEYVKVLENSLTPYATDELNYNDYVGYSFSLFEKNFTNSAKLNRSFDLRNAENSPDLQEMELQTQTNINLFNTKNTLQTQTKFDTTDPNTIQPDTTNIKLTNVIGPLTHRSEFDYGHQEEIKVDYIENREILRYNRNRLQLDYRYYIHEQTFTKKIPEVLTYFLFYYEGNKIYGDFDMKEEYTVYDLDLNFLEKSSNYSFGIETTYRISESLETGFNINNRDKSEFAKINFDYNIEDQSWDFTEFEIQKKIVCWTLNVQSKFSLLPQFDLASFRISFFINYIPDKNISYGDDGFEFGLM
jgi:lipopolysaccharide export LptBFGC system permease protein LptF